MSILHYFAHNSVLRLLSFGVSLIAAFLVTPHMLRCLERSGYGAWALISSLAGYYLLLDLGLFHAVCKYTAAAYTGKNDEECARIYSTAFVFGCLTCALTLILAGVLALCASRFAGAAADIPSMSAALGIYSASVAVQLLFRSSHAVLAARMRWNTLALLTMLHTVFTSTLVLWLVNPAYTPAENLLRIALITACGNILEFTCHYALTLRGGSGLLRVSAVSMDMVKKLFRYGLPVIISSLGGLLKRRTQIFIVASFLGLAAVTLFSLAQQLIDYMDSVMLNAFGIMSPYFSELQARGDMDGSREALLESMRLSYAVAVYMGLSLIFYGGLFLTRWLGPQYGEVRSLLLPLGLAASITLGSGVVSGFLLGVGAHRILATLSIGEGLAGSLAAVPAAWLYGLEGVAWVMAAASLTVHLGILPAKVCRAAGISLRSYHAAMLGTVVAQAATQGVYYLCVMNRLEPEYLVIVLACSGQLAVAALTLGISMRVVRRAQKEAANNVRP